MSAVRIENDAWTDWRFDALGQAAYPGMPRADSRDMAMLRFFRIVSICTDRQSYTIAMVACDAIGGDGFAAALVRAELAEAVDDRTVRIRGTAGRIEWLKDYREARQQGGKARAKTASRGPNGTFARSQPAGPADRDAMPDPSSCTSNRPATDQQTSSWDPAGDQHPASSSQPYVLRTTSGIGAAPDTAYKSPPFEDPHSPRIGIRDDLGAPALELGEPPPPRVTPADLEAAYKLYPRKEGKAKGLKKAREVIRTPADLEAFRSAVTNYAELMRREGRQLQHVKAFDTFVGCWVDYLDPAVLTPPPMPTNGRQRGMSADEMYAKALELERQGR